MKILSIELYNYQRLRNKGINHFKATFTEKAQVILGKNGSGKSSIMWELSPLPPNNDEYAKGGYKRIVIEHKGSIYELYSQAGSPSRHSFFKDNVEQNASKTMNAQKVLCKEHFDYTPEIHELILGLVGGVSFTTMSTSERREWFMALYPNDLSFVDELHEVLKTMLRDTKGGIKINSKHLAELFNQKKEGNNSNEVQQRISENQVRRDKIARLVKDHVDTTDYQAKIHRMNDWLRTETDKFKKPLRLAGQYESRDDLIDQLQMFEKELSGLSASYDNYSKLLIELKNSDGYKQLEVNNNKESWVEKRNMLDAQLNEYNQLIQNACVNYKDYPVWQYLYNLDNEALRIFLHQANDFYPIIMEIPSIGESTVTVEQYKSAQNITTELDRQVFQLGEELHKLHHRLKHFTAAERTECPSCHYKWVPGMSDMQASKLQEEYDVKDAELKRLKEKLEKANRYLSEYNPWFTAVSRYYQYISSRFDCQEIYSWLEDNGMLRTESKQFASILPGMCDALSLRYKAVTTQMELKRVDDTLKMLDGDSLEWYKEKYNEYESRLTLVIEEQRKCKAVIARIKDDMALFDGYTESARKIALVKQTIQEDIGKWGEQVVVSNANQEYRSLVKQHETDTALLYSMKSLEGSIQSTEALMGDLEISRGMLDRLVTATSPVKGLVAEQLSDFIGCFIGNMNSEIDDVWLDNLTITPCSIEEGALSFRFPTVSGDDLTPSKDVSITSTGETQIINWIYRVIVMRYLGFTDYPLHLDEVGANFDEAHRIKMMSYIKKLLDSGEYSQVFMISHYFAQHGSMINAEVCALSTDGVALPEKYNDHVMLA